jgi:hypothetical protein
MAPHRIFNYFGRILVAWLAVMALAASEHHGIVKSNGIPVPGATVTASQGDKKLVTTTGDNGEYAFADLPDGIWTITVEMLGFAKLSREIGVTADAASPTWDLKVETLSALKTDIAADEAAKKAAADATAAKTAAATPAAVPGAATPATPAAATPGAPAATTAARPPCAPPSRIYRTAVADFSNWALTLRAIRRTPAMSTSAAAMPCKALPTPLWWAAASMTLWACRSSRIGASAAVAAISAVLAA